jgi:hypothetical protein
LNPLGCSREQEEPSETGQHAVNGRFDCRKRSNDLEQVEAIKPHPHMCCRFVEPPRASIQRTERLLKDPVVSPDEVGDRTVFRNSTDKIREVFVPEEVERIIGWLCLLLSLLLNGRHSVPPEASIIVTS